MLASLRQRLTYANLVASLSLFLVVGGGTALSQEACLRCEPQVAEGTTGQATVLHRIDIRTYQLTQHQGKIIEQQASTEDRLTNIENRLNDLEGSVGEVQTGVKDLGTQVSLARSFQEATIKPKLWGLCHGQALLDGNLQSMAYELSGPDYRHDPDGPFGVPMDTSTLGLPAQLLDPWPGVRGQHWASACLRKDLSFQGLSTSVHLGARWGVP